MMDYVIHFPKYQMLPQNQVMNSEAQLQYLIPWNTYNNYE